MFEKIIEILLQILTVLHELNRFISENFAGILLLVIMFAMIITLRRVRRNKKDEEAIKKLAEAIIKYQYQTKERE